MPTPHHRVAGLALTLAASAFAAAPAPAQASVVVTLHDRGGGLVYDELLDVTWLRDANYAKTSGADADGFMTWQQAVAWTANLTYHDSVRGVDYDDWRLPTVAPVNGAFHNLASPVYDGTSDLGYNLSAPGSAHPGSTASELAHLYHNGLHNVEDEKQELPTNAEPFFNLKSDTTAVYWSGTPISLFGEAHAFAFRFYDGLQVVSHTDVPPPGNSGLQQFHVLAVRDGDVAAVPEPASILLLLTGLAAVGAAAAIRRLPSPLRA